MILRTGNERVLVISDLQVPYEHKDALEFMVAVSEAIQPTRVINIGDEVDQHAIGRFDPDPDAASAGDELRIAKRHLAKWYDAFPVVDCVMSNHTRRIYKKAFHAGIPEAYLRPVNEWLDAPDTWTWYPREVEIDGVRYEHGDAQGGMYAARNLAIRNRQSTVIGHHHSGGGVHYIANDSELIFGLNTGCLIDVNARAFEYGRMAAFKPTLGCGVVLNGVPYFVPMLLTRRGRWTGELIL